MMEFLNFGKLINNVSKLVEVVTDSIEKDNKEKFIYNPVLTFKECLNWVNYKKLEYPEIKRMLLSIKRNPNSKSENDKFEVLAAALNEKDEPIRKDNRNGVSILYKVKSIDLELLSHLDGKNSIIIDLCGGNC